MKGFKTKICSLLVLMVVILPLSAYLLYLLLIKNFFVGLIFGSMFGLGFIILLLMWKRGVKDRMIIYKLLQRKKIEDRFDVPVDGNGLPPKTIIDETNNT